MKAVQPEMTRLKELHKEDKVKLQQEMMSLYTEKKKINPLLDVCQYLFKYLFLCNL